MLPWMENLDDDVKTVIKGLLEMRESEEDSAKSGKEFVERIRGRGGFGGVGFNTIPPIGQPGDCQDILVVACGKNNRADTMFSKALDHIQNERGCPNTKHIIFVTAKEWIYWWNRTFRNAFKDRVDSLIVVECIGEGGLTKAI